MQRASSQSMGEWISSSRLSKPLVVAVVVVVVVIPVVQAPHSSRPSNPPASCPHPASGRNQRGMSILWQAVGVYIIERDEYIMTIRGCICMTERGEHIMTVRGCIYDRHGKGGHLHHASIHPAPEIREGWVYYVNQRVLWQAEGVYI